MLQMLNKRRNSAEENGEGGFTLIELMVVVLIIGILIAIAVPTFLGAQKRAKDRAAQSNVRQALSSGKTLYTDKSSYLVPDAAGTLAELKAIEPGLNFQATASDGPNELAVGNITATTITFSAKSKNGHCFYITDDVGSPGGTTFTKDLDVVGDCPLTAPAAGAAGADPTSGPSSEAAKW